MAEPNWPWQALTRPAGRWMQSGGTAAIPNVPAIRSPKDNFSSTLIREPRGEREASDQPV